jgi:hypothetical protein
MASNAEMGPAGHTQAGPSGSGELGLPVTAFTAGVDPQRTGAHGLGRAAGDTRAGPSRGGELGLPVTAFRGGDSAHNGDRQSATGAQSGVQNRRSDAGTPPQPPVNRDPQELSEIAANLGRDPQADLERQGAASIAVFPPTLAGMAEVARADKARAVDTEAIAALVNRRRFGPYAVRSGRLAASHAEALGEYTVADVEEFMRAAGLSDRDIAQVRSTSFTSGLPYPGASLVGNLLQYVAVPSIGVVHGPVPAAVTSGVFVAAQIATAAALQPAAITWSEQIAKSNGPFIEVDKTKINYKVSLAEATRQLEEASDAYAAALQRWQDLGLSNAQREQTAADASQLVAGLTPPQRADLEAASTALGEAEAALHDKHQQLFAARGGQQRQWEGAFWQIIPRSVRAPASTALGFLTGAPAHDGDPGPGMRTRQLSSWAQVGAQGSLNIGLQLVGHAAAGVDEFNKVWLKTALNVLYADVLNDAGHAAWQRGEPVRSDHIDAHQVRKLFSSPPQAIGKVVAKLERANLAALRATTGHDVAAANALEREVNLLEAGRFDQLDPHGPVGRAMLAAASGWTSALGLVAREAWSRYSVAEITAQVVQRVSQAAHGVVLGSAAATVLPRAVAAIYGGTSHLPTAVIGALTAASFATGFIGAITQFKSQTQKNYNKERSKDLEPEGPLTQIGKGMAAGVLLATENRQSDTATDRATDLLRRSREDLVWVGALRDALAEAEQHNIAAPHGLSPAAVSNSQELSG